MMRKKAVEIALNRFLYSKMNLEVFLEHKPLYYGKIDYMRMPRVYGSIKSHFKLPKIIHVVGTNGKGTTGRFIANMLLSQGCNVGHYSSPHILKFNERIWINGKDVSDILLETTHQQLIKILSLEDRDTLSYFEYTTFLAMLLFSDCDYVILEAGLGGEHDATNVFAKELSVLTPIAYDHQDFLGSDILSIARTKCNSITHRAVIAKQKYEEVIITCKSIAKDKGCELYTVDDVLNEDEKQILVLRALEDSLPKYLEENLLLAVCAVKLLGFEIDESSIKTARPFGRLYQYRQNITIDVGHNSLAAEAVRTAFLKKKVILVYNSYADKDYAIILKILQPIIEHVEILDIDDARMIDKSMLQLKLKELGIIYKNFTSINAQHKYLVFGSFKVVEAFVRGNYA